MLKRLFCKLILVAVVVFGLLAFSGILLAQGRNADALEHVRQVQQRNTNRLMAKEGIEGAAIGLDQNDRLTIKVFTAGPGVRGVPKDLDGVPVQVVVTGKFYALDKPPGTPGKGPGGGGGEEELDPTSRFPRPVPIGVSTGNEGERSAGTIGCRVTDGQNMYVLSNNHVYALQNTAPLDSKVLQPGRYDGGKVRKDTIGTLTDYVAIDFTENPYSDPSTWPINTIDAAIAAIDYDKKGNLLVGNATPDDGYGTPSSETIGAEIGLGVQKYGRTTGLTNGTITATDGDFIVNYGTNSYPKLARFVNQIVITPGTYSAGGDSGSLVVTQSGNNPVGLLFAGSDTLTIANPIDAVLGSFGVSVDGK